MSSNSKIGVGGESHPVASKIYCGIRGFLAPFISVAFLLAALCLGCTSTPSYFLCFAVCWVWMSDTPPKNTLLLMEHV